MTGHRRILSTTAPLAALLLMSGLAEATTRLQVTVLNAQAGANQAPLDGAVVCVGTSSNRASQGRRTTSNGLAVFEALGEGSWTITAWRSGFAIRETSLVVNSSTGTFVQRSLQLLSGSATDPCIPMSGATSPTPSSVEVKVSGTPIYVAKPPTAGSGTNPVVTRYVVAAQDAISAARSKNFTFTNSTNLCPIQPGPIPNVPLGSVSFGVEGPGGGLPFGAHAVCSFQLFGGRSLAAGWRFLSLDWSSLSCIRLLTPSFPAASITTQLRLREHFCRDLLKSVTLEGPAGSPWLNAFQ